MLVPRPQLTATVRIEFVVRNTRMLSSAIKSSRPRADMCSCR